MPTLNDSISKSNLLFTSTGAVLISGISIYPSPLITTHPLLLAGNKNKLLSIKYCGLCSLVA